MAVPKAVFLLDVVVFMACLLGMGESIRLFVILCRGMCGLVFGDGKSFVRD